MEETRVRDDQAVAELNFMSRSARRAIVRGALIVLDLVAVLAAGNLATVIRFGQWRHVVAVPGAATDVTFARVAVVLAAIWLAMLFLEHLYDFDRLFWGTGEYTRVGKALAWGIVVFILATYVLKMSDISRLWTIIAFSLAFVLICLGRASLRWGLRALRRRGWLLRPTLIVGFNAEAADIIAALRKNEASGLVPIGCLASSHAEQLELNYCEPGAVPCLGYAGDIGGVLDEHTVDTVLIASTAFDHEVIARIIADLRGRDVDIQVSSGLLDVTTSRVLIREVAGVPLITIRAVSFSLWKRVVKRTFDLLLGTAIVVIGLPVWLLIALAVKVDSRGPVFYRQRRVGRGGKPFDMLKFRSMVSDADAQRGQLADGNEATGPLFKMKDDPRVTRVGRWMRKFSIDEFPQLLNVLRGEMSLVGPRPPLPGEVASYTKHDWRRMEVLPGMTGLWQVSGRSTLTFAEMVRLDLFYIENWSVGFDLSLMLRTIPAVLFARGAY